MVESGLRFAFAFLPAGVAVVVGLVLAVQRRRVQPDVATPAIWGLLLQLLAILAGASINVVPSAIVQSGGNPQTAVTISTVISLLVAALTVVSWVLILTALFRRLPAAAAAGPAAPAGSEAPTTAVPTPPPGNAFEPFADDAPTGRHALLDEHGQQVVAQPGVRLSPQTAGLAGGAAVGAAGLAAYGSGAFAATPGPEHGEDLPTEAVPVVRTSGVGDASLRASGEGQDGTVDEAAEQPDPGPAGVDEAAVGGTPTGPDTDSDGPSAPADVARPATVTPAGSAAAGSAAAGSAAAGSAAAESADPGPAGVDEAAVGGTPTGPDPAEDGATDVTPVVDTRPSTDGLAAAADVDVDEAAVGGTPTSAESDPGTADDEAGPAATPSSADSPSSSGPQPAVSPRPSPSPSAPFPASGPQPASPSSSAPFSASRPQPAAAQGASGPSPSAPFPATGAAQESGTGQQSSPASAPQPSAPQPAARPTPRPTPAPATDSASTSSGTDGAAEEPEDPSSGAAPASHPGLAGTMRAPRPTPTPAGGNDLFSPSAPIPAVPDEAVGGTPAEPQQGQAVRARSSQAPVAGWFEPATDGAADGFGSEREN